MRNEIQPRKLLVVLADDDSDDRELFTEVSAEINPHIQIASVEDGQQLMNFLEESSALPVLIFLDLNMPKKSGKECLTEIRNNPLFSSIPIVIYSTSAHQKDIQETYVSGANLYVPKPNTFKRLNEVLTKIFSLDPAQLKLTPPIAQFVLS